MSRKRSKSSKVLKELPDVLNLNGSNWDCCVIGNGASALWLSHWLWSSKKSVLWITSDEPFAPERAMLQKGWLWGAQSQSAHQLTSSLQGFDSDMSLDDFEVAYFDSKSSKTFKKLSDSSAEWGKHEKDFFSKLPTADNVKDLWSWHGRLYDFHSSGDSIPNGPVQVELFKEPRFVRVQNWPLYGLNTTDGKITGVSLSQSIEIKADRFYLGDFHESLHSLIASEEDASRLASVTTAMAHRAGFGLQLWHEGLDDVLTQTVVIPLLVSASAKKGNSHIVGRFLPSEDPKKPLRSFWIGLLDDVEVEDNNEILRKIKQTKRAIDRAIPGFAKSIVRESVSFEQKMFTNAGAKNKRHTVEALGAVVFSDSFGPQAAIDQLAGVFGEQ